MTTAAFITGAIIGANLYCFWLLAVMNKEIEEWLSPWK